MTKILSFCNKAYIDIALNWAAHLNKLNISNYYIVCLDHETYDKLHESPIFLGNLIAINQDKDFLVNCNNTVERLLYLYMTMTEEKNDILMCDLDALWLKDPMPLLTDRGEEIIFSTVRHSNAFPREMYHKFGLTCCMGWVLFRANIRTLDYLNAVYTSGSKASGKPYGSDQKLFNTYLMDHIFRVCKDEIGDVFRSDYQDSSGEARCLPILCLDKEIIKRGPITKETYVWHPNTRKEAFYKKEVFLKHDKWLI